MTFFCLKKPDCQVKWSSSWSLYLYEDFQELLESAVLKQFPDPQLPCKSLA